MHTPLNSNTKTTTTAACLGKIIWHRNSWEALRACQHYTQWEKQEEYSACPLLIRVHFSLHLYLWGQAVTQSGELLEMPECLSLRHKWAFPNLLPFLPLQRNEESAVSQGLGLSLWASGDLFMAVYMTPQVLTRRCFNELATLASKKRKRKKANSKETPDKTIQSVKNASLSPFLCAEEPHHNWSHLAAPQRDAMLDQGIFPCNCSTWNS